MEKVFGMLLCSAFVISLSLVMLKTDELSKKYKRLILVTILLPIIIFILHRTCFFGTVPHCKHCVIYEDGHEATVDANDLRDACIYTYFLLQLVLIPKITLNIESTGKMLLYFGLLVALTLVLGYPVIVISYM